MWDVKFVLEGSSFYFALIGSIIGLVCIIVLGIIIYQYKKQIKSETGERKRLQIQIQETEQQKKQLEVVKEDSEKRYQTLKETIEQLEKAVYMDYLTELPNRKALVEMLENVTQTLRKDEIVVLMVLELNDLKVNNITGKMYNDQLLIDVAYRLRDALGEDDFLAKIGENQFAVLTQNIIDIQEYDQMLKRLQKIFSYPFLLRTREIFLSISMGVALAPKQGTTASTLMKHTVMALTEAKENGKNMYVYFDESMNEQDKRRLELQAELHAALTKEEFIFQYQPIFELNSMKLLGFEALIRWNHPERGILKPEEFLLVAEESGLIVSIGRQLFQKVCIKMKEWDRAGFHEIKMAINISSREFRDRDFTAKIQEIFTNTGANPKNFIFEIEETIVVSYLTEIMEQIQQLKQLGVSFALDNFGAGNSSFNDLKQLPITMLKIAPSMIQTIETQEKEQIILEAILSLAQKLQLTVVAKGVEEIVQEEFLKTHLCSAVQGYLYEVPLEEQQAENLLMKQQ